MSTVDRVELGEDVALLTGKIYSGDLEDLVSTMLTQDRRILAGYHRYITDPEILKAMLAYLAKGEKVTNDSTVPFD